MIIKHPTQADIPGLRSLWLQAFGDTDAFLDSFFSTAFSPDRCLCISADGTIAAALYWFDCSCRGKKMAYLYAVATDEDYRGRGLCHALMEHAHSLLQKSGYAGVILVPGGESLFRFYGNMGYITFGGMDTLSVHAEMSPVVLQKIGAEKYAALRKTYLPQDSVLQEGITLSFLQEFADFFAGDDFVFVAFYENDQLICPEFMGNTKVCGNILTALNKAQGQFRTPGNDKFAMYLPLTSDAPPSYFGLALD